MASVSSRRIWQVDSERLVVKETGSVQSLTVSPSLARTFIIYVVASSRPVRVQGLPMPSVTEPFTSMSKVGASLVQLTVADVPPV